MKSYVALSALVALAVAQNIPANATEEEVLLVEQAYNNSGLNEPLPESQGFELPLEAQGLLTVSYNGTVIVNGQDYPRTAVATLPDIYYTPLAADASNFTAGASNFTLILADASAVGGPDPEGEFRHFLANGAQLGAPASETNATQILVLDTAVVVTSYAGPGPLENSGIHRYAWLLFAQDDADFTPVTNLSAAGIAPSHWSVHDYVEAANLGALVGATFFTVTAEGTASFTPGSTSAPMSASTSGASSAPSTPASANPSGNNNAALSSSDATVLKAGLVSLAAVALAFALVA